jgi:hypothetical protein
LNDTYNNKKNELVVPLVAKDEKLTKLVVDFFNNFDKYICGRLEEVINNY